MMSIPVEYRGEKYLLTDEKTLAKYNYFFAWQNKEHICVLMKGKKPVCGILSGDFEAVRSWVNRKNKEHICVLMKGKKPV